MRKIKSYLIRGNPENQDDHVYLFLPLNSPSKLSTQYISLTPLTRFVDSFLSLLKFSFSSWPKSLYLANVSPAGQSFSSWPKFLQLVKVSLFGQSFSSWPKFLKLVKVSPAGQSFSSWPKFLYLAKVSLFG